MATTFVDYTGDGNATKAFSFPSYKEADIKVEVDNVIKTSGSHYNITSYTTTGGGNVVFTSGNIPSSPAAIRIYRDTDVDTAKATFTAGSAVKAGDLNNNMTQILYSAQEEQNQTVITSGIKDGAVTTAKIKADNITSALIADDQIDSEHYVADSIDSEHYAPGSVDTAAIGASQVTTNELATNSVNTSKIIDLNVTRAKLEADAIDGSKLADNAVNTEHYTDNSIQHVHLQNDIIDGDNIQDDVVNNEHIAPNAVRVNEIKDGEITSAKLNPATVITASEQSSATTNDTSFLTSAAADARFFNISTGDTIKDGVTFPDNDTTIATTAAINDRIIDLVDDVGGFVPIANETSFPTANPDVNNGAGTLVSVKAIGSTRTPSTGTVTIANGAGSGNTVTITGCGSTVLTAGFGVIVETTTTLHTYAFHRLVPKATEVTTVAGISGNVTTVAGISANTTTVAGISANVTTVAGIASNVTSVAGNASNINSAVSNASNINSAVSNASNINTVAGSISNVNTAATNIASINNASSNISSVNNFGDTYQVASSNPSTDGGGNALAEGDLYFNTTANELKVYNGSAWQGGVTASGNFAAVTGNTFTGSNIHNDNVKSIYGTSSDGLEIFHNASDSVINDQGTGTLKVQTGGSTKLEIQSGGVGVTGNIVVSGNVDGRDVAADGTKLDGIETSATADQTAAEIRTLVESASDSNVFTDADHTKLNGIEASATADQTDEEIQDIVGAMLTGNTEAGITVTYQDSDGTIDFSVASQTDENFTTADHSKLDGIEANATADQTAAEIRTLVESASDSNVFTDADHTKLNGIEASATADQTAAEIVALVADQTIAPSTIDMEDSEKILLGTGDDLEIYHDGSHSYIRDNGEGNLVLKGSEVVIQSGNSSETKAIFRNDGACELYHNDSKKAETVSGGFTVTGTCTATAFSGNGSSLSNVNAATLGSISAGQFMRDDQNQTATGLITLTTGLDLGSDARCAAAVSSLSDGATITVDFTSGIHHTVTLGGNRTFGDPGNTSSAIGQSGSIFIVQDGTGSRTASFHGDFKFAGGTAPTLSTAANAVDRLDYIVRASDNVHCVVTLDVK